MKESCEVIKDLLPLYYDGVCSNDSKQIVEQHLAQCVNCNAELQAMQANLPYGDKERNLSEAEPIKILSERWKKGMLKSTIRGALITIVIIIAIALVLYMLMDVQFVPKITN